jgi:hypothetical protein
LPYNGSLNRTAGLPSLSLYALSCILLSVKAATYDGTSSWLDYKSHFDACSRINQWSENEKGLYLAVALRGQAQGILGNLPIDKQQDYKSLVKALI